jgi:hypothetical protein
MVLGWILFDFIIIFVLPTKGIYFYIQWKPLNVIALGQRESDNINRLITLTEQAFRLVDCKHATWASENFNLLITLTE